MNAPKRGCLPKQKTSAAKSICNNSFDVAEKKVIEEVRTISTTETLVLVRT